MNKPGIIGHNGCGFTITFTNGVSASVIWSEHSYTERGKRFRISDPNKPFEDCKESEDVEVLVSDKDGRTIRVDPTDDVVGYMTPGDLALLLAKLARLNPDVDLKTVHIL